MPILLQHISSASGHMLAWCHSTNRDNILVVNLVGPTDFVAGQSQSACLRCPCLQCRLLVTCEGQYWVLELHFLRLREVISSQTVCRRFGTDIIRAFALPRMPRRPGLVQIGGLRCTNYEMIKVLSSWLGVRTCILRQVSVSTLPCPLGEQAG